MLALQGDVREHLAALRSSGAVAVRLRRRAELDECDAVVIPGGESSTVDKLLRAFDLFEPLGERIATGMPVFGTCAGMILLADRIEDGIEGQETLGGLDVTVRRNAFGRQVDSFEGQLSVDGFDAPFHAVFIRAPWVEQAAESVQVLATVPSGPAAGRIVAVRQGRVLATAFHPEMSGDDRMHRYFVEQIVTV